MQIQILELVEISFLKKKYDSKNTVQAFRIWTLIMIFIKLLWLAYSKQLLDRCNLLKIESRPEEAIIISVDSSFSMLIVQIVAQ